MTGFFGNQTHVSQDSRALSSISESQSPDLSGGQEAFVKTLQQHSAQIRYLSQQMLQTQKGVDEATANPIKQLQQFIADLTILFGAGELPVGGLEFGELQYFLPTIGALLGFGPGLQPKNLLESAEHFFMGYVVPQQQFTDAVNASIQSWATGLGIDAQFVHDLTTLNTSVGDLFDGINNLGPSLHSLFTSLGMDSGDLGPLGEALKPIIDAFAPIDFTKFGSMIEFITDTVDPWITQATASVNWINALIAAIGVGGDVVNSPAPEITTPFHNLISLFAGIDFSDPKFATWDAWDTLFTNIFADLDAFLTAINNAISKSQINAAKQLYGWLPPEVFGQVPSSAITDAATANLISDTGFYNPDTDVAHNNPTYDPAVHITASSATSPRSMRVTADGALHKLRSESVTVQLGQTITVAVEVLTVNTAGSSDPVLVYVNGNPLTTTIIPSPATTVADWTGAPNGATALTIEGTVTVDATMHGVAHLDLWVPASTTTGTIWFAEPSFTLKGGIITDLSDGVYNAKQWIGQAITDIGVLLDISETQADRDTAWHNLMVLIGLAHDTTTPTTDNPDPIGHIKTAAEQAQQVHDFWQTLFTTLGVPDADGVATYITTINGDFTRLINDILAAVGLSSQGSVADISDAIGTLVHDIANNQDANQTLSNDHATSNSDIAGAVYPTLPAAPIMLGAVGSSKAGIPGVAPFLGSAWYRVTAINAAGESSPSGEAYITVLIIPAQAQISWLAVPGATSYRLYKGTKSGKEDHYLDVGNVTSYVDTG